MKRALIVAVLVAVFSISQIGTAAASCGFKPFKPLGCKGEAVCICDEDGNCSWFWVGC